MSLRSMSRRRICASLCLLHCDTTSIWRHSAPCGPHRKPEIPSGLLLLFFSSFSNMTPLSPGSLNPNFYTYFKSTPFFPNTLSLACRLYNPSPHPLAPYFSSLTLGSNASSVLSSLLPESHVKQTLPWVPVPAGWSPGFSVWSLLAWPWLTQAASCLCFLDPEPGSYPHHGSFPGRACKLLLPWTLSSSSPLNPCYPCIRFQSHLLCAAFLDPPSRAEFSLPLPLGLSWHLTPSGTGSNGSLVQWFVYFCVFPPELWAPPSRGCLICNLKHSTVPGTEQALNKYLMNGWMNDLRSLLVWLVLNYAFEN